MLDLWSKILDILKNDTVLIFQLSASVGILATLIYYTVTQKKNYLSKQVLKRIEKNEKTNSRNNPATKQLNSLIEKIYKKIESKAKTKVDQANLDITVKEYITFLFIGSLIGGVVGFAVFPFSGVFKALLFFIPNPFIQLFFARILAAAIFGFAGHYAPYFIIQRRIKVRREAMKNQLLDFIFSLADGIKTTQTTQQALRSVAEEIPMPLAEELKKTVKEIDFAIPYEDAIRNLDRRINLPEYSLVFRAMVIQNKTGGQMEKMLRNMSNVVEGRRELRSEILKTVRETKSVAYILAASPFGVLAMLFFLLGEEFYTNFSSFFGLVFLIGCGLAYTVALVIMVAINKSVTKIL